MKQPEQNIFFVFLHVKCTKCYSKFSDSEQKNRLFLTAIKLFKIATPSSSVT